MSTERLELLKDFLWALVFIAAALWLLSAAAHGQEASAEDKLRLQVVLLRSQLAEALKATAKCEAEGSKATQQLQEANTEGQALLKALEARGLTVNAQNEIVPKKPQ
jgi:Skp family chaperone for outer membrane proteins